jgi:hypothetical protein
MKALTITDLSMTTELDSKAMKSVRGGMGLSPAFGPKFSFTQNEFNFGASQMLGQEQNTMVNNGNNAAFVCGITSNVNPTQNGHNNISIGGY